MTLQENDKYYYQQFNIQDKKTQLNLLGLFNDMYDVGDAHHELGNAWISINFYKMNNNLSHEDFFLVGIAPAKWNNSYIDDPIAFVTEDKNGSRFWSHGSLRWVKEMRNQMQTIYNNYIAEGDDIY